MTKLKTYILFIFISLFSINSNAQAEKMLEWATQGTVENESYNSEIPFPRRIPTPEPGDLNRVNWEASLQSQGFTALDENPNVLNSQRLWWDINNPAIGSGGN